VSLIPEHVGLHDRSRMERELQRRPWLHFAGTGLPPGVLAQGVSPGAGWAVGAQPDHVAGARNEGEI
jgi:hypothetical protein